MALTDRAEFDSFNRFTPRMSKITRRIASMGIEAESIGQADVVTLRPGESMEVRCLPPYDPAATGLSLRLYRHIWPPFKSEVQLHAICPVHSDSVLLDCGQQATCEACQAGVSCEANALVFVLTKDWRRCCLIKFTSQNLKVIRELGEAGAFDFQSGRWVRLHADERWRLSYTLGAVEPLQERDFLMGVNMAGVHAFPYNVRKEKLHTIAEARRGFEKAGQPEPDPGACDRLKEQLPSATLIPIPWGAKGPSDPAWQNTPHALMSDDAYLSKLTQGSIGLLCGRDTDAVNSRAIPDAVTIGLDADNERFADLIYQCNPWLENCFKVESARGCKWFFMLTGAKAEKFLRSSKINQIGPKGEIEVGDLISTGKQGVCYGLHPTGIMYKPNEKPMLLLPAENFRLPRSCYLSGWIVNPPTVKESYAAFRNKDRPPTLGPILDEKRLQKVHRVGNEIECACPACQEDGRDSAGDNLKIWSDGRFKCAAYISLSAEENHRHNQRIYALAGIERPTYE